jgi:transporter family-2 protein
MMSNLAVVGYMFAIGAGVSFVFQQAVNSSLRAEIGSAWWAGFISYLGGTIVMLIAALVLREPWVSKQMLQRSHLISWSGGLFGAIYIAISIFLIPRFGTAMVIALLVTGQMLGSLTFDHFGLLGVPIHPATPPRLAGAALLIAGVVLIRF